MEFLALPVLLVAVAVFGWSLFRIVRRVFRLIEQEPGKAADG